MIQSGSYPDITNASTFLSNPTSGTIVADSGSTLDGGNYVGYFIIGADTACRIRIEHRDSGNANNLNGTPVIIPLGANAPIEMFLKQSFNKNERFRIVMDASLTGNIAGTINMFRIT